MYFKFYAQELLAQEKRNDAHRETKKARLIGEATRSRKIQNKRRIAKLACAVDWSITAKS